MKGERNTTNTTNEFWQLIEEAVREWDGAGDWDCRCDAYRRAVRLAREATDVELFRYMDRVGLRSARQIVIQELGRRI